MERRYSIYRDGNLIRQTLTSGKARRVAETLSGTVHVVNTRTATVTGYKATDTASQRNFWAWLNKGGR